MAALDHTHVVKYEPLHPVRSAQCVPPLCLEAHGYTPYYGLDAARAGTGSRHLRVTWPVLRAVKGHFFASLSMQVGFAQHTKVASGVLAGRASQTW
eukprot:6202447-Pleurochrysis_carterae.AAC.1